MAHIRIPKPWDLPAAELTPPELYFTRREFLQRAALAGAAAGFVAPLRAAPATQPNRNPKYKIDGPLTAESAATNYNNFSEFTDQKEGIEKIAERFTTEPWTIRVSGLVKEPRIYDIATLKRTMKFEERLYRLRCVEGWSMAVPWLGFPLADLIRIIDPLPQARFVRFVSFMRPDQAPAQRSGPKYTWPRYQALTMAEALNELTMLVTGIYGHDLPKQCGAPIRLVVPWKYGFKSLKSITEIEFVDRQPQMFYNSQPLPPDHFIANVNPEERYMGRSQRTEKLIGSWEIRLTMMYNGYGQFVAYLYR